MKTKKKNTKIRILQSIRKIAAAVLALGMNFGGLPAVVGTSAFFSDAEISFGNQFRAGSLNVAITPESAPFLPLASGQSASAISNIIIANNGTLPLYYDLSVAMSTAKVCGELEMSVDGLNFMALGGFYFESPNKLLPGVGDAVSLTVRAMSGANFDVFGGQTCNFALTARARQENLQFGQGFDSSDDILLSVDLVLLSESLNSAAVEMLSEFSLGDAADVVDSSEFQKETESEYKNDSGEENQNEAPQESMKIEEVVDESNGENDDDGNGGDDSDISGEENDFADNR